MLNIPHRFETGRLLIKDVLPTSLIRREIHFFASLLATGYVGPVNNIMGKGGGERISMHWMFRTGRKLYKEHF